MSAHDGGEAAYGAFGVIGDEPGFPRGKAERGAHAVQEGAAEGIVIEEAVQVGSPAPAAASPKHGAFLLFLSEEGEAFRCRARDAVMDFIARGGHAKRCRHVFHAAQGLGRGEFRFKRQEPQAVR